MGFQLKSAAFENDACGEKRQYFPYVLEWECPDCSAENTLDFRTSASGGTYLSYPEWGEETIVPLFCKYCEHIEPVIELSVVPRLELGLADG